MQDISTHLSIAHNNAELGVDEAVSVAMDIQEGYMFSIPEMFMKTTDFKKFVADVQENLGEAILYDYSSGTSSIYHKYVNPLYKIYARGNPKDIIVSICSTSEEINQKIWKLYLEYSTDDNEVEIYTHSYYMNGNTVQEHGKVFNYDDLKYLSKSYYPYLDIELMFDQFFTGAENILLVVGKPGLGKSKLSTLALKYAYENTDKLPYDKFEDNPSLESQYINVAFVKSISVLSTDKFWQTLESNAPDFVIIDDLDYMLTKRDSEIVTGEDVVKNQFLNQFLSFTDGVEKHKSKFIITTNQSYDDIDTALLRKGRLFDILELRALDNNEAKVIWMENGLDCNEFKKLFGDDKILAADIGSEINKRLNKRLNGDNKATQSYVRESGISKVQRARRSKRIGL